MDSSEPGAGASAALSPSAPTMTSMFGNMAEACGDRLTVRVIGERFQVDMVPSLVDGIRCHGTLRLPDRRLVAFGDTDLSWDTTAQQISGQPPTTVQVLGDAPPPEVDWAYVNESFLAAMQAAVDPEAQVLLLEAAVEAATRRLSWLTDSVKRTERMVQIAQEVGGLTDEDISATVEAEIASWKFEDGPQRERAFNGRRSALAARREAVLREMERNHEWVERLPAELAEMEKLHGALVSLF